MEILNKDDNNNSCGYLSALGDFIPYDAEALLIAYETLANLEEIANSAQANLDEKQRKATACRMFCGGEYQDRDNARSTRNAADNAVQGHNEKIDSMLKANDVFREEQEADQQAEYDEQLKKANLAKANSISQQQFATTAAVESDAMLKKTMIFGGLFIGLSSIGITIYKLTKKN